MSLEGIVLAHWVLLGVALLLGAIVVVRDSGATTALLGAAAVALPLFVPSFVFANVPEESYVREIASMTTIFIGIPSFLAFLIGNEVCATFRQTRMKILGCGRHGSVPIDAVRACSGHPRTKKLSTLIGALPIVTSWTAALLIGILMGLGPERGAMACQILRYSVPTAFFAPSFSLVAILILMACRRVDLKPSRFATLFLIPIIAAAYPCGLTLVHKQRLCAEFNDCPMWVYARKPTGTAESIARGPYAAIHSQVVTYRKQH